VEEREIDWDGTNMPAELRTLPPGRYHLVPVDDDAPMTEEEDAAVREGLDSLAAGRVKPFDQVFRELRSRLHDA
jgi:hypothetical protein